MKRKSEVRSAIGRSGMMIYTPNQREACIAYENGESSYTIRNESAFFWSGREELFHITYCNDYTKKEERNFLLRIAIELIIIYILPFLLVDSIANLSIRTRIGIQLLLISFFYILEFSILKGFHRRKFEEGKKMAKMRGALNKAINAFEKINKVPTLEEIRKASIYRMNPNYHLLPQEIASVIFIFTAISFFMPTVTIQIITIPVLIWLMLLGLKTSLFGILTLSYTMAPETYELEMASDLIAFWFSVSYKDSPEIR